MTAAAYLSLELQIARQVREVRELQLDGGCLCQAGRAVAGVEAHSGAKIHVAEKWVGRRPTFTKEMQEREEGKVGEVDRRE